MTKPRSYPSRASRAVRSATVWFSAAVPVLLAIAESFKDQLPLLNEFLSGWRMVAASVAVSAVVAYIPSRLTDNPYLMADPDYVKRIRGSGPSWFVRAILLGDWNIAIAGKVIKREWWKYHAGVPADTENPAKYAADKLGVYTIVQSWDFAARAKESNDRSVCVTMGCTPRGWLVLDVWAGRLTFPDLKKQAVAMAEKWGCFEVLVEDASSGIGIIDELKRDTLLAIKPVRPVGGKYERALAVSALIEQGLVLLPNIAVWLSDFLDEVCAFPEGAHDDIVDAITQALKYLSTRYTVGEATAPAFVDEPRAAASKNTFAKTPSAAASGFAEDRDFNHTPKRRGVY